MNVSQSGLTHTERDGVNRDVFSLSSPEGGEGRGEEASMFPAQIPSPQPSPRLGGEREAGAVSRCAHSYIPARRLLFNPVRLS